MIYIEPPRVKLSLRARLFGMKEHVRYESDQFMEAANLYINQKEWQKALESLRSVLSLEPASPYIHCLIGDCYHQAGNDEMATIFYREVLRLSGKFIYNNNVESALYSLGCIYHKKADKREALECFRKIFVKTQDPVRLGMVKAHVRNINSTVL
ncbi:MAG: tetratricopeptide repeat protein [Proteobacteria bacterium]|nr:tetratricopeptide repeat protein [Pseudomonadota bacterium]